MEVNPPDSHNGDFEDSHHAPGSAAPEEFCQEVVDLLEQPSARSHLLESVKEEVRNEVRSILQGRSEAIVSGLAVDADVEEELEEEISIGI